MKILYAIQGTGNGHIVRAQEIIPVLQQFADVDILISGTQSDISLPWPVKYKINGLGFVFGKKGGIDFRNTVKSNSIPLFLKEVTSLPVSNYDLVFSDFEPVSAWACKIRGKKCVGMSHQAAVLHKNAPKPLRKNPLVALIMNYYAPVSVSYGFHFKNLGGNIFTPVIRSEIRNSEPCIRDHYTVYLPAYDDLRIINFLSGFPDVKWDVFSKHSKNPYSCHNIKIQPVNKKAFTKSMINSKGVFCNAGFETPAEALFLKKKLCVIPMKGQYEQQCNAAMLESMGVTVIRSLTGASKSETFRNWLRGNHIVKVDYADITRRLIEFILEDACNYTIEYFPFEGAILMPAR